jgi:thiol-disulfide isomerase/thioredoxin
MSYSNKITYLLLFIFLFLLIGVAKAQVKSDAYQKAVEYSYKHQVKVFIFFESDGCGFCKKMRQESLKDNKILRSMYQLRYNIDTLPGERIVRKILQRARELVRVPFFYIFHVDENHKVIIDKYHTGYMTRIEFEEWLNTK